MSVITVRDVRAGDAFELAELFNAIIARGGTTAFEEPFTADTLRENYLMSPRTISCVVAVDETTDRLEGFQMLGDFGDPMATGTGDIGTFVRIDGKQRGVGRALFAATCANARAAGVGTLNASIRADNAGGLTFYAKLGFVDHAIRPAVPLADGTPVDRIYKRYALNGR